MLIAALRKDLDTPGLPWFIAELADQMRWGKQRLDEMDAQLLKVAAADPRVWFVRTAEVPTAKDCVTFGSEGVVALGKLLAERFLAATR